MDRNHSLSSSLYSFSKINEQFRVVFEHVLKSNQLKTEDKDECLLNYIALELLVTPTYYDTIQEHFSGEFTLLVDKALNCKEISVCRHVLNCILLGNVVKNRIDLQSYALRYFSVHPSPFEIHKDKGTKRRKMQENIKIEDLDIVESCLYLLRSNPDFYRTKWNWSLFIKKYINHDETKIKWIMCHILAVLFGMNEYQLDKVIFSKISEKVHREYSYLFYTNQTLKEGEVKAPGIDQSPVLPKEQIESKVVNISGIYIPSFNTSIDCKQNLVMVSSTCNNLRKIALGLTSGKAICLQGSVGTGKTCLVEYLSNKTGRKLGENFLKIQLGDETDSKMLLGTYRCTDVPGEFVWQPGVLTQAVVEGSWLLLEDIDSASMDIASIITSLLENRSLTVPGYKDSVPITPGFQLFLTQRLIPAMSGYHKKHSNTMTLLGKSVFQITIDPLSSDELKQILDSQFPQFKTIAERMISVFLLFAPKALDGDSGQISVPRSGRLISTRDFFKWCSRAVVDFDVKSQASALKVLQDAIDVFCCSFSNTNEALELAKAISTHLGIINQKAEYFFKTYKPTMQLTSESLVAGRVTLKKENNQYTKQTKYSFTRPSAVLLERIMCCISLREPVLLVGETGTGKTSCVQFLAHTLGKKLIVINMNQQSDSADLLGGFKPVDMKYVIAPVRREFEAVFSDFFKIEPNRKYLANVALCFNSQRWGDLLKLINKSYEAALSRLTKSIQEFEASSPQDQDKHKQYEKNKTFLGRWQRVGEKLHKLELQLKQKSALAFAFIEGSLVKAVENGHWVLLDEINLANAETLECLSGLLEGSEGSLCLLERGDKKPVQRHPDFTLFACMNPSTDVGKKDLPAGLRNRFTEFFVDELNEKSDLTLLVNNYLEAMSLKQKDLKSIVDFYVQIKKEMITSLSDGLGHKPHFSLRSLCRALTIASKNPCGMFKRSLYEAFCLSFLTQLDSASYRLVEKLISSYLIGDEKSVKAVLKQPIPEPKAKKGEEYVQFEGYWIKKGPLDVYVPENYILTDSVRKNLKDLVRVVSIGKLPVLLQGDTSVGKTSLIMYLAKSSGYKCVRINNHEHTDLQEYIGSYVVDVDGKLVFREGVLVEAMRKGHWIILDELNLAPTDVLEALNRVLDDNRELFIPETQETVQANPNFMLFATQNPPGAYGGRKMLSRAFRNRFVELHFNEIPPKELEVILHQRCQMAPSYARKMIAVMTDLQTRRRGSAAFAGKQGFITLRDLFRWGERYRLAQNTEKLYDWDQHLADEGYLVLAGRVRKVEEKLEIIAVLKKHLKREVLPEHLFTLSEKSSTVTKKILEKIHTNRHRHPNIVWTYNMRELAVLVSKALQFKEPVLLVGETGGGKTTVCQLIADYNNQELVTVNCHMHTESGDFIGGLRPVRDHSGEDATKLFEWSDGPLIKAMLQGNLFLADEISLADDSVLERLNSLLEPERTLLVAEKSVDLHNTECSETVVAHDLFHFIGTMNPGGDFGKKELSPALRNRFTEIWCEPCIIREDLIAVAEKNVKQGLDLGNQEDGSTGIGKRIVDFVEWFRKGEVGKRFTVSIRDILTWVNFINACATTIDVAQAYVHGACLTFLDSLGSGVTSTESSKELEVFRSSCISFLLDQVRHVSPSLTHQLDKLRVEKTKNSFGIKPFFIESLSSDDQAVEFVFNASTTVYNTMRLLRGMQLNKAILLEGSPGVGKTSLVTALANCTGHELFRVNLSDQTDISDLFGADLPVEGGTGGQFSWRDGPLLQALKNGSWILLDELNLASQSVLEGLNACLDHRGEIYIPELDKTFHVKPGTKFFGCQNPLKQGGSRRGLPRSFLNRFIQVHVTPLTKEDLECILEDKFTSIPPEIRSKMIEFNTKIASALDSHEFGHQGAPWECNLRDIYRWCEVTAYHRQTTNTISPESTITLIYGDRMRCQTDKDRVADVFEKCFGRRPRGFGIVPYVTNDRIHFGDVSVERGKEGVNEHVLRQERSCLVLRSQLSVLRSLTYCVNMGWMAILTGSSGSGKSLAVKTLANLSGKSLRTLPVSSAMDTADLLGGFEQTDYSRHLDEISKELERISFKTIHSLLENNQQDSVIELLARWEAYRALDVSTNGTMDEEVRQFLRSANKLRDILETLKNVSGNHSTLEELSKRLSKVADSVEIEQSLNAGGKFEWVDSVLIKCLRNGDWLVIDNVNLCSAAVLDRLNALLEPRGVLTVSERGVGPDGKLVEIKPHKDFRLFLTMDPKNGEISRAMRNRGVEIHLLGFNDVSDEKWETLSLMELEGLKATKHMAALCRIETFLNDLILGEKPQLNELLKTASLIAQQLSQGTESKEAFCSAVIEVYYKSRSSIEFNCNNPISMIRQQINIIMDEATEESELENYRSCVTLKTRNLERNSVYEKICQQGFLLETSVEYLSHVLPSFFSISSKIDLEARFLFLQNKVVKSWLPLISQLYEITSSYHGSQDSNLPLDHQWLPDTTYTVKNSKANVLTLALILAGEYHFEKEILNAPKPIKGQITLLDYMHQKKKKIVEDRFNEIIINEYLNLIRLYDDYVGKIIKELDTLTLEDLVDMLHLIHWRFVFQKCSLKPISKISSKEQYHMIVNLKVHYKWFYKFAVKKVELISNVELPHDIRNVLLRINKGLNTISMLQKVSKSYRRHSNAPLPLANKHELDVVTKYNGISQRFDVCDCNNDIVEILSYFESNKEIRKFLVEFKSKMAFDVEGMSEELQRLVSLDEMYRKERSITKINERELEILPLVDHFNHLEIIKSFSSSNLDPLVDNVLIPINLSGTWALYIQTKDDKLLHELSTSYYLYLSNSASVRPFKFLRKGEGEDSSKRAPSDISPKISYYVNSFLSNDDNGSIVKLGNFRQLRKQHDQLTAVLWRNFYQLCGGSYDFLECHKNHVTKLMSTFVSELASGLSVNEPTISNVINMLEIMREQDELSDPKEELLMLTDRLKKCAANIERLSNVTVAESIYLVADIYMEIGYIKATLNSKLPLIDPLAKKTLKKKHYTDLINRFTEMLQYYEKQNMVYNGSEETLHPICDPIKQLIKDLQYKNEVTYKYVAVRSEEILFEAMLKEINFAFNTFLNPKHVSSSINKILHNRISELLVSNTTELIVDEHQTIRELAQLESSVANYEMLVRGWSNFRDSYPDIIHPLLANLTEFLYGLKLKLALLRKLLYEHKYKKCLDVSIDADLANFCKFPVLDDKQNSYGNYVKMLTSRRIKDFVDYVLKSDDDIGLSKRENSRLLKCAIQEAFNHCAIEYKGTDFMNRNTFAIFIEYVDIFIYAWNKQQEEKEIQEQEAESLYKTRTKCDDQSEEEQILSEMKELFPDYHTTDFSDFQNSLDFVETKDPVEETIKETVSYEDLKFVMNLHTTLLKNFTKSEWLNPDKNNHINHDFLLPVLEKQKVFAKILERTHHALYYKMDKELFGSMNVVLAVTQRYGDIHQITDVVSPTRMLNKKSSDFYKDSNVEEVKSCYHILEELKRKILELLQEWPDQPTLRDIVTIIERIYSFDMNSPISRFLTGFEILLRKCHEWEEVAHSGVSLNDFPKNLIEQIIAWRKLELNMWKDLLNKTYDRMNESISKWWLYIYNVCDQFITKSISETDLIQTLQTFITKSNLAEFQSRLDLLYVFHCHAAQLPKSDEIQSLTSIFWNLHWYFEQYSQTIANKIKDLRSPIEKKLRDYVKIVRWKDINYWAVKETIEKSHRTLHKYMREFRDALQQPVMPHLHNLESGTRETEGIWDRPQRQNPSIYHYTLDADIYVAKQSLTKKIQAGEGEILSKAESYFLKSRKLCKETILATEYPTLVQSLDSFVTEIIETNVHLQNLEVDKSLPKAKQISQAKSILQQKHRALADLFKNLNKIGLSYKTGLLESKLKKPSDDFVQRPIDLIKNFSHINHGRQEEKMLTIWNCCEMYYIRSQIRTDVLETALQNPSKDLGPQNIERCKGFSAHLLALAQHQKRQLTQSSRLYYYLRYYLLQMNEFCEGNDFLHVDITNRIATFLKNTTVIMNQYKIILNTCPSEDDFTSGDMIQVPILKFGAREGICYKYSNCWSETVALINDILTVCRKISVLLQKCKKLAPAVEYDLVVPEFIPFPDLSEVLKNLDDIKNNITSLKNVFDNNSTTNSLTFLQKEVDKLIEQCQENKSVEIEFEKCKKHSAKLTEEILVVIQNLYKKYSAIEKPEKKKEDEDESVELKDENLKKLLVENLVSDVSSLDMKKILTRTHKLAKIVLSTPPQDVEKVRKVAYQSMPLLEQLIQFYQYFITQQVAAYRVTCKMMSILLNIFIELASKGFCIPPELSDEMDKEGVSKPSDGLGLGEGQGERDVSDKIESEDQLEDAQPAGQEKKQEEDQECKEEEKGIEMSEDFEGKMQDVDKKGDEEDSEKSSDDDEDADEQMGETEKGADQLDQEIWGSDKEEDEGEQESQEEETGDKGEKEGESQLGAKEQNPSKDEQDKDNDDSTEEKEKSKKDINEMKDPEFDDDQVDPYHGDQKELPEPEPMDLPDDLQLDEGQQDDKQEEQEENPFDVDAMKDQAMAEEKEEDEADNPDVEPKDKDDEADDISSDDEDINKGDQDTDIVEQAEESENKDNEDSEKGNQEADNAEKEDDDSQKVDDTALDQTQSHQDNVEAMETDSANAADKTEATDADVKQPNSAAEDIQQEDQPDKDGAGQSQMEESTTGHSAATSAPQETKTSKREAEEEVKQKPGDSDSQRSLGDVDQPVKKKLKTVDSKDSKEQDPKDVGEEREQTAEMYEHIKEGQESKIQTLDIATKEQAESQRKETQHKDDEIMSEEEPVESSEQMPEEQVEEIEISDIPKEQSDKVEETKEKQGKKGQHPEGEVLEEMKEIHVEGEVVQTSTVPRPIETTHHTTFTDLSETSAPRLTMAEMAAIRGEVEQQLAAWSDPPSCADAERAWQKISSVTGGLAQELSEQLRLVLEPTLASRLKGDFRTGRRINMRKVIPYIASQFRKDKIWLRRTKPSKRDYQIVIAIDDSSSMADNHSKELAFESVALISKALTLLESGQLSVVSFGERVEVIHKLTEQFTDRSGTKLLQKFRFDQNKTNVGKLVDFATEMFSQSQKQTTAANAKLLVIVSDGRGVFSEGESYVRQAVRRAKLADIFMVFVIVDNPESKSSVLDIRMPVFKDGKLLGIESYMDFFPFSFYIILRDINSLPNVLSDALRQWFEIVSNLDK